MKRRVFILLALIGFLAVLMPKQSVLAVCNCYDPYSQCLSEAVTNYENCTYGAQNALDTCLFTDTHSVCDPNFENALAQCDVTFTNAEYSCDATLGSCLYNCGQSGGGGGVGTVCNDDDQMGYQAESVSYFAEVNAACITDGGSAFTGYGFPHDTYDTCMSNLNNQELCCRGQTKWLLDTYAICNISQHHPLGCHHCVTF
jgi:hypothetical protein